MKSAVAVAMLLFFAPSILLARDFGQWAQSSPELRQWFQMQRVPGGTHQGASCCSEADGEQVEEDIRDGHYWIKGGHFPDWTQVPDEVVIREPNKHGQPIAWWAYPTYNNGSGFGPVEIRCYAPGAMI